MASYSVFLITSLLTALLNLLKSAGTGANLSISNLFSLAFKIPMLFGKPFNLSISSLSTSVFKLATFVFSSKMKYLHE